MIDFFVAKSASGESREIPDIASQPTLWVRYPSFPILCDAMLQSIDTLVRLPNGPVSELFALRKPQQWLIVSCKSFRVAREAVLVMPNNLPAVFETNLIQMALDPTKVMMNAVNKYAAAWFQDPFTLAEPLFAPRKPF